MKKYTIEDLREGRVAVINDGTLEELNSVLKLAFSNASESVANSKFYYKSVYVKNNWACQRQVSIPTQSVKDFLIERKIIGYKLLKPEYERLVLDALLMRHIKTAYNPFIIAGMIGYYIPMIENLGIMDWFEPVYEEEPKLIELTIEEIASKIGVDAKLLRIKK